MSFLVITNVVASRPPERQPTGTLTARANRRYKPVFRINKVKKHDAKFVRILVVSIINRLLDNFIS